LKGINKAVKAPPLVGQGGLVESLGGVPQWYAVKGRASTRQVLGRAKRFTMAALFVGRIMLLFNCR